MARRPACGSRAAALAPSGAPRRPVAAEPSQGRDRTPLWCNACLLVASGGISAVVRCRPTGARAAFELEPWQLAIGLAPRERTGQPNRFVSRLRPSKLFSRAPPDAVTRFATAILLLELGLTAKPASILDFGIASKRPPPACPGLAGVVWAQNEPQFANRAHLAGAAPANPQSNPLETPVRRDARTPPQTNGININVTRQVTAANATASPPARPSPPPVPLKRTGPSARSGCPCSPAP